MVEHIYIHIPFCSGKCHYCSFVSGRNIKDKDIYLSALCTQIDKEYKGERIKTLYFGGGTPSMLSCDDIKKLVNKFNIEEDAEITLEVNPETVDYDKFLGFKSSGINRISLGVQTFDDEILKQIGRRHNSKAVFEAVDIIKKADFKNISIDLIYGLPNQTIADVLTDIEKALLLDIQHLSFYGLKIEKGTYFEKHMPKNIADDELQAKMYKILSEKLKNSGFEHYEISNFAKYNYQSKHNNSYWQNKNYYGFGLNASGYVKNIRYKNESDFQAYINNPLKKEEENILTPQEMLEDEIFLALRLRTGIDINFINKKYGIDFLSKYRTTIEKYVNSGMIEIDETHCRLTILGVLLSSEIMCEFIEI